MKIRNALVSVFDKEGLEPILQALHSLGIGLISTGGTHEYIRSIGLDALKVEDITGFPSIFGGRVKTLHPHIFGGILYRRDHPSDLSETEKYMVHPIDLVIVDLYPFEETVSSGASDEEIIEKIDIGGISLIRAAAKNYKHVLIVPAKTFYSDLLDILKQGQGEVDDQTLLTFAKRAFDVTAHYDSAIHAWFPSQEADVFRVEARPGRGLRYGENPHQKGQFFGELDKLLTQLHGKELSYNNLLDIDAALRLIREFEEPSIAILKHNNACGLASRESLSEAWEAALAADPISAFGGIIAANREIDVETATGIDTIFCEVVMAPSFQDEAFEILKRKKNRILLLTTEESLAEVQVKTALNGFLVQDSDSKKERAEDLKPATDISPSPEQVHDLLFANIIVKHTKSNAIVLVKNRQLLASGTGQTSRVDALKQAIAKAESFGFDLKGAVMASDAFFPFADSVEIAQSAGITAVIQPGGSVRDQDSIDFCNKHGMAMAFTGIRHFKH